MKRLRLSAFAMAMALLVCAALVAPLRAQEPAEEEDSSNTDVLKNLKFRNLGPAAAGGRVSAVVGIPGDSTTYYVGAGGGGVFKTVDGGLSWKPIFEHQSTSSIGDIALAASDPNMVWVGTGEANPRNDVIDGAGVFLSPDAGQSWKFMGLGDVGQISRVIVDPLDPNVVFVAALGHVWAPNADRGVYRTTDCGKTWKKVLFVDDTTGAADLAMEPGNPQVLYAGMWHFRRYPWTLEDGGDSSGLYRSTDGGETWKKLTQGLPDKGPLGRMAVAVAPSNPSHVYTLIGAKHGMLWQSFDRGDHWTQVSDNHALDVRPFYFSRFAVSPINENKLYFLSLQMMESDDGGKTAHVADRGVHSDHHAIWIDPRNPQRIIQGNDGGVNLSFDGAKTWRFLDSLPIEQFYMVAADSAVPYTLCGGLQDNSAWCGPSSNLGGRGVSNADWYTVAGGDGEYAVPAPSDSNIIYADAQNGSIRRLDKSTHLSHGIRPYLEGVEELKPSDLKYRFNWTTPIAVSATDANEIYLGGNVVFKSTDGGKNWTAISGDLTRNDKSKQDVAGGPVQHDISGAESYDTILCITLAPTDPKVIWVGSDDGLVHVTRDGGKNWTNTTPNISGAPEWARVYQIGVSPFDAGTAYVSYDAHELGDRHAYVYKTSDYGSTWQKITNGLPDAPVYVLREDPNQRGFLVLGNDSGLFYSADDGGHWQALKANFPTVPVYDLKFKKATRDLMVATHGRGLFVLDDIRPLEELNAQVEASDFHLFSPAPGTAFHHWRMGEGFGGYAAPNAPEGVLLDYFLKSKLEASPEQKREHQTPVKIVITDARGQTVNTVYGPSAAGVNRFVWNMRYEGAKRIEADRPSEEEQALAAAFGFGRSFGPAVLAGTYHVAMTVKGQTEKTDVQVEPDPTVHIDPADFRAQTEAALEARNKLTALNEMINRIDNWQHELTAFENTAQADQDTREKYKAILAQAHSLDTKLKTLKATVYDPNLQRSVGEDDIHYLSDFQNQLQGVLGFGGYGEPPTPLQKQRLAELSTQLDEHLKAFNDLLRSDVGSYNKAAYAAGAPTLFTGPAVMVQATPQLAVEGR